MLVKNLKSFVGAVVVSISFLGCSNHSVTYSTKVIHIKRKGTIYLNSSNIKSPCNLNYRLKTLLRNNGWKIITKDRKSADYQLFTNVQICKIGSVPAEKMKQYNPVSADTVNEGVQSYKANHSFGVGMMIFGALLGIGNSSTTHNKVNNNKIGYRNRIYVLHNKTYKTYYLKSYSYAPATTTEIYNFVKAFPNNLQDYRF